MTLRTRLFLLVSGAIALTVALVTWTVSSSARHAFEALEDTRLAALISQLHREYGRESEEVAQQVEALASSDTFRRMAVELASPRSDRAAFVGEAATLAAAYGLDFLDIVAADGTIVSSAQWPARFGYRHPWALAHPVDAAHESYSSSAFLHEIELPRETVLGLMAVRPSGSADGAVYLAGGRRLDRRLLQGALLPDGMRALLYCNLDRELSAGHLIGTSAATSDFAAVEPLIAHVRQTGRDARETVAPGGQAESVEAVPLTGRDGSVLGVLLIGSSRRELAALLARIRWSGIAYGGFGILAGLVLSYAVASRITVPISRLADAAGEVAAGNWDARIGTVPATSEIGAVARAFDTMTQQLVEHRDRLVQAERVAAWREVARRLAHELKNPLFPLRLTIDNLRRARSLSSAEYDEVVDESLATLSAGLANLNTVIRQFSDFARMPPPEFQDIAPNDVVRDVVELHRTRLQAPGRPPITLTLDLDPRRDTIRADPSQLGRALENLLINAIDAMPRGGALAVRTRRLNGTFRLEVSDTGHGLSEEERQRAFTPYYTTKDHGTGLGLAIVQSMAADHHGRVRIQSEPGRGTTVEIEIPAAADRP